MAIIKMYTFKLLLIALLIFNVVHAQTKPSYQTGYASEVPVDHYSYTTADTFKIRYFYNLDSYKPGGPIFFYPGNEGDLAVFAANTGIVWDIAPLFNAAVIFIEHRYWGESRPYGEDSFTTLDKIGYMTSIQAIGDFAQILPEFISKFNISTDSKIIAIGGSYGGMLAVWMKMKYPTLVHGVWASSAPMVWFNGGGTPLGGYGSRVQKAFKFLGCDPSILFDAFGAISELGKTDAGRQRLSNIFNITPKNALTSEAGVKKLLSYIQTSIENLGMTNYPYPTQFLTSLPAWPIKVACGLISKLPSEYTNEDLATLMFQISQIYYNSNSTCLDVMACGSPESATLADVWDFQKCTEIIIELCPEGPPNDFFPKLCNDRASFLETRKAFCSENYGRIGWTEALMREDAIKDTYGWVFRSVNNIIFTNGDIDPWGAGGVTDKTPGIADGFSHQVYTYLIEGSAHHLDLRQPSSCDPENVRNVRYQVIQIFKTWLDPSLSPYEPKSLPPFVFPNNTDCKYQYNQYPWGQN